MDFLQRSSRLILTLSLSLAQELWGRMEILRPIVNRPSCREVAIGGSRPAIWSAKARAPSMAAK
jgi:hypothetical protein